MAVGRSRTGGHPPRPPSESLEDGATAVTERAAEATAAEAEAMEAGAVEAAATRAHPRAFLRLGLAAEKMAYLQTVSPNRIFRRRYGPSWWYGLYLQ